MCSKELELGVLQRRERPRPKQRPCFHSVIVIVQQGSGQAKLDFQRCAAMVLATDDLTQQEYSEAAAPFGLISAV